MKLNGDIAKIWKHTCTFSSPIAWFQAAAPFPDWEICSPNLFPSTNLLLLYMYSKSLSSMPPFRRSSHAPFPLIFVSASQTKYAKENPLSFLLFPFFFRKSECSFRISYFHMYAATLIPFSLTKYFSYVFECTYLSEIWIVAPILLPNKKNENRENKKNKKNKKKVSNLTTYQGLK